MTNFSDFGGELHLDGKVMLFNGDSRDVLKGLPDASVDSVVTDPPYALVSIVKRFGAEGAAPTKDGDVYSRASAGFMGKQWDTGETAFAVTFWAEVMRVLKPGGHVIAASGTRTYHRLAVAIEDAGFEVRDMISWLYGSGFPKSHDVSKGIDRLDAAVERRRRNLMFTAWMRETGITAAVINEATKSFMGSHYLTDREQAAVPTEEMFSLLRPLLPEVPQAIETLVSERTVESENFQSREVTGSDTKARSTSGKSALPTVGGSVVYETWDITAPATPEAAQWQGWGTALKPACEPWVLARKPLEGTVAGNVLAHGVGALNIDGCRVGLPEGDALHDGVKHDGHALDANGAWGFKAVDRAPGLGRWPANVIHDGSDEVAKGGIPLRYFYSAKADSLDRVGSKHPTVKPVDLMQYLCRLITPPGGIVLDPFAGSGSTGEAAWREGFRCVLIEREEEYADDIRERMKLAPRSNAMKRKIIATKKAGDLPEDGLFSL